MVLFFQNQELVVLSMTWLIDVMKYVIRHDHFEALQFEMAVAPCHDMKSRRQFQEAKSNFINKRGSISLFALVHLGTSPVVHISSREVA